MVITWAERKDFYKYHSPHRSHREVMKAIFADVVRHGSEPYVAHESLLAARGDVVYGKAA